MGRTAKFTDDLLLEAVMKYSEEVKTPIKASELARWARKNITGLEEVCDYHFTRPVKNPATGKIEKKLCTQRIEELNVARDTRRRENTNALLSSVNMDRFFNMDTRSQRSSVLEAREIVSEYKSANIYLRKQNDYYKSLISEINKDMESYAADIKDIKKRQTKINKKIASILRDLRDDQIKSHLEEMGIMDGDFDLEKYNEALREDVNNIFNIEKAIKQYQKLLREDEGSENEEQAETSSTDNMIDDLLDF